MSAGKSHCSTLHSQQLSDYEYDIFCIDPVNLIPLMQHKGLTVCHYDQDPSRLTVHGIKTVTNHNRQKIINSTMLLSLRIISSSIKL